MGRSFLFISISQTCKESFALVTEATWPRSLTPQRPTYNHPMLVEDLYGWLPARLRDTQLWLCSGPGSTETTVPTSALSKLVLWELFFCVQWGGGYSATDCTLFFKFLKIIKWPLYMGHKIIHAPSNLGSTPDFAVFVPSRIWWQQVWDGQGLIGAFLLKQLWEW